MAHAALNNLTPINFHLLTVLQSYWPFSPSCVPVFFLSESHHACPSAWNSFILSVITWGLFSLGFRLSTTFSGLLLFLIFFLFFFHSTYHNLYSFYLYVYFIACLYCTLTNMRAEVIYILFTIVDPALYIASSRHLIDIWWINGRDIKIGQEQTQNAINSILTYIYTFNFFSRFRIIQIFYSFLSGIENCFSKNLLVSSKFKIGRKFIVIYSFLFHVLGFVYSKSLFSFQIVTAFSLLFLISFN